MPKIFDAKKEVYKNQMKREDDSLFFLFPFFGVGVVVLLVCLSYPPYQGPEKACFHQFINNDHEDQYADKERKYSGCKCSLRFEAEAHEPLHEPST